MPKRSVWWTAVQRLFAALFCLLLLGGGFLALEVGGAFPSCNCGQCHGFLLALAREVLPGRPPGNESRAIGSLKAISAAQSLYREGDKDCDGVLDYGNLTQLGEASLIDSALASGTKQGYRFRSLPGPAPQFTWWAFAVPTRPGCTGDRAFYTNHTGVIFYTSSGSPIGPKGVAVVASHLRPIGQ